MSRYTDSLTTSVVRSIPQFAVTPKVEFTGPMTPKLLRRSVLYLLTAAADERVDEFTTPRPDVVVEIEPSRRFLREAGASEAYLGRYDEVLADAEAQAAADARARRQAVRAERRANWDDIQLRGMDRLMAATASYIMPRFLCRWLDKQWKRQLQTPNAWALAYTVLVIRNTLQWEWDKFGEALPLDGMGMEQHRWIESRSDDSGRQFSFVDEESGELVTVTVGDGTSRQALDLRGFDQPTSYARRTSGPRSGKRKVVEPVLFIDRRTGHEFERTATGWYHRQSRCSTSIAQRLEERVASGRMVRADGKPVKRRKVRKATEAEPVAPAEAVALLTKAAAVADYTVFTREQLQVMRMKVDAALTAVGKAAAPAGSLEARQRLVLALKAFGTRSERRKATKPRSSLAAGMRVLVGHCPQASTSVPALVTAFGTVLPPVSVGHRSLALTERLGRALRAVTA